MFLFNFEELGVIKLTGKHILKIGKGKLIIRRMIEEPTENFVYKFYNRND